MNGRVALGPGLYVSTDFEGVTIQHGQGDNPQSAVRLSIADLEELVRVAVTAGILVLEGGGS